MAKVLSCSSKPATSNTFITAGPRLVMIREWLLRVPYVQYLGYVFVFFAAFLPQFTSDSGPAALQSILLGIVFGILAVCSDSVWALGAGKARDWFARKPHRLDKLSASGGGMMITLGVTLAASE